MKIKMRWVSLALSLLGVGGVGLTSWLSIKCHEKAKNVEDKKEKVKAYIPAIISGVGTSACILGSHHVSAKEIAALTASCTYLAANKEKVEKVIKEKFGTDALKEVKQETAKSLVAANDTTPGICYERTGKGDQRFFFYEQGRYFVSSWKDVIAADRKFNDSIRKGLIPSWNDYYDLLGISNTREGEDYVVPENCFDEDYISRMTTDEPIIFEYVDTIDEYGIPVTIIYVDTTVTPYGKEL